MGLISDNKMSCYSFVSFCSHPYFLPFPSSSFPPFYSLHFMPSPSQRFCFSEGFLPNIFVKVLWGNKAHWHFSKPPWHCSSEWWRTLTAGDGLQLSMINQSNQINVTGSFSDLKEFSRSIFPLLGESKCSLKMPVTPCLGQVGDPNPHSLDKNNAASLPHILRAIGF